LIRLDGSLDAPGLRSWMALIRLDGSLDAPGLWTWMALIRLGDSLDVLFFLCFTFIFKFYLYFYPIFCCSFFSYFLSVHIAPKLISPFPPTPLYIAFPDLLSFSFMSLY